MSTSSKKGTSALAISSTLIAAALIIPTASAAIKAYDGFDYATGNLVGQAGGTWDATRAWASGGTANGGLTSTNVVPGLTLSDFPVAGNAAEVLTNHNGNVNGDDYNAHVAYRQLPGDLSIPSSSTVYVSFLFNHAQEASFANESQLLFGNNPTAGGNKLISRTAALFGNDGGDRAAVGPANEVGPSSAPILALNNTYLVISKFTNINGPLFGSGNTGTMWVLTAANYDAIKSSPLTEAALDANNLVRVFKNEPSDFTVDLTSADYLRLSAKTAFGINNRSTFDEVRLFTELSDLPGFAPIPEPSSIALLSLPALALLRRRTR